MQAGPEMGLGLPMKALVWQDEQGRVQMAWNDPGYLAGRYGLSVDQASGLAAVAKPIDAALR